MRLVEQDDGTLDVFVRQSWINDAISCPERGRNAIVRPDWSLPNEMTVLGTAVHAGIEHALTNRGSATLADATEVAQTTLTGLFDEPLKWVRMSANEVRWHVDDLIGKWFTTIEPQVAEVIAVEWSFTFVLDEFMLGERTVRVHGEGTADCVTADGLWDWKTSGKPYQQRDKQSSAVQPTMYGAAAVAHKHLEWPVTFRYGVMVRRGKPQVVPVTRSVAHANWLVQLVRPFIRQAVNGGVEYPWIRNDTHYLCNETWCPWWSVCKGAHIAPSDNISNPNWN